MKRSSKYIIALLITLLSVLAFSACNKVEFKVSFVVDSEVYHTIATSGDEIIKMPDNPTKDGYIFDGWYWDKDVWKKPFTADSLLHAPLSDNMTVYAKWRAEEELMGTEAAFGGDFKKTNEDEYSVVVLNSVSVFSLNNIVTVNLKSSWVLATDVFANDVIASRTVSLAPGDNTYYVLVTSEDENFKLYTIHIRRRPIFNVIFNTDGGTEVVPQDVEEGDLATEPSSISKIGYNFIEWDFDFSIPITSNKTIAAIWEIKTYSVTFNGNGGTLTAGNAIQTVDYGSSAIAPVYVKEGYTLSWDKAFNDVTEEIIVNAIWTIKTYIVTFDGNGGTLVDGETEQTIDYGNSAIAPVFEKEGYTLNWDKAFDHITENITIAAVWAIKTYTVTFDGNSGTYSSSYSTSSSAYASSRSYSGGIVGQNDGQIKNCFSNVQEITTASASPSGNSQSSIVRVNDDIAAYAPKTNSQILNCYKDNQIIINNTFFNDTLGFKLYLSEINMIFESDNVWSLIEGEFPKLYWQN